MDSTHFVHLVILWQLLELPLLFSVVNAAVNIGIHVHPFEALLAVPLGAYLGEAASP